MPTYDYACDGCGHAFEQWQSFKDATLTDCPACHTPKLRRLIGTGAAIVFKGSGFYDTDYRQKDEAKKAEANKPKVDAGEKSGAKPEAKPDAPAADSKPAEAKPAATPKAGE